MDYFFLHTLNFTKDSLDSVYEIDSSSISLFFHLGSPRPSDGRSSIDRGIKTGEGLNISTQFIGYPLPIFSWNFKRNVTDNPTSVPGQHQLHSTPVNVSTIQTGFTKETLSQEEFGFYTVTATTPGKQSQTYTVTFHVIPESKLMIH